MSLASSSPLNDARREIATKVRDLRKARGWSQAELAARLEVSQGRLSVLERGDGSFTAEQFLTLLRLFRVTVEHFAPTPEDPTAALQNALARAGASHLNESSDLLPSSELARPADAIRATVVSADSPRLLTALAPVLVRNVDQINLKALQSQLKELALERRLFWVVDNTRAAIELESEALSSRRWAQLYRRAAAVLDAFLATVPVPSASRARRAAAGNDILDKTIRSPETLASVVQGASSISRRWRIATSIKPEDFATALRGARASDP